MEHIIPCSIQFFFIFGVLAPLTRLAAASDKVYQLLAHGRWFSPGTPVSVTTKTGRHDIAEKLLNWHETTITHSLTHSSLFR
jgi:hypothetical protein